jgi:saccharopine dehydrogenase-like NADP-dependent oxidoreductase
VGYVSYSFCHKIVRELSLICTDSYKMKTVLVLGAGRSSSSLINYLLSNAASFGWRVVVGDVSVQAAKDKIGADTNGEATLFDINNSDDSKWIANCDVVISLLPPPFHPLVAAKCLQYNKHLITASYVSEEMKGFASEAKEKNLVFLNECGLDPGIDHMSAMQIINSIRGQGGRMISFESFTGGLIAPETDQGNPWRYKFTWNPRNVVMAGQGTARFIEANAYKYIPYQQLFARTTKIDVPGLGEFEGYANRDSLKYIDTYELGNIATMVRGTLRNKGFCSAWNVFVQLGCCDDTYQMEDVASMTHASFLNSFLPGSLNESLGTRLNRIKGLELEGHEVHFIRWSGFFDHEPVGLTEGTPAVILEHILNKKWKLASDDKDQIVMWHRFIYDLGGAEKEIQATLIATGTDSTYTAMAKTVGLPLGIAAKRVLLGQVKSTGVMIPTTPEIYEPVLKELVSLGVELHEREIR